MLEGVIQRGTGKGLKDLNLDLAGKTGTTNENTDAWFIGFTSNLVIGVYVGYDEPKSLGKYETGSKTCLLYTSPSPRDGLLSRMPSSA